MTSPSPSVNMLPAPCLSCYISSFETRVKNITKLAQDSILDQNSAYWYIIDELEKLSKIAKVNEKKLLELNKLLVQKDKQIVEKDIVISYLESKILKLEM
jgi:hypothetical protein